MIEIRIRIESAAVRGVSTYTVSTYTACVCLCVSVCLCLYVSLCLCKQCGVSDDHGESTPPTAIDRCEERSCTVDIDGS